MCFESQINCGKATTLCLAIICFLAMGITAVRAQEPAPLPVFGDPGAAWDLIVVKPFTSKSSKKYALGTNIRQVRNILAAHYAVRFLKDPRMRTLVANGDEAQDSAVENALFNKAGGYKNPDKVLNLDRVQEFAELHHARLILLTDIKDMTERVSVQEGGKLELYRSKTTAYAGVEIAVFLYDAETRELIHFTYYKNESIIGEKKWSGVADRALAEFGLTVNRTAGINLDDQPFFDQVEAFLNSPVALPFKFTAAEMLTGVTPLIYERLGLESAPQTGGDILMIGSFSGSDIRMFRYVPSLGNFDTSVLFASLRSVIPHYTRGVFMAAGDFDADGSDELALSTDYDVAAHINRIKGDDSRIVVFDYRDGAFSNQQLFADLSNVTPEGKTGAYIAAGDFNGDGRDELAVSQCKWYDAVRIFQYTGGAFVTDTPLAEVSRMYPKMGEYEGGAFVAAGDFDGDGRDELVTSRAVGGNHVKVYQLQDSGLQEIADLPDLYTAFPAGLRVAAGDFDGDGRDELVVSSSAAQDDVRIYTYADGKFDTVNLFGRVMDNYAGYNDGVFITAGDFDGDGRDELVLGTQSIQDDVRVFRYENGVFNTTQSLGAVQDNYVGYNNGVHVAAGKF